MSVIISLVSSCS